MNQNKENQEQTQKMVTFKPSSEQVEYQVLLDEKQETVWATELEIAEIFGRNRSVVNRHIKGVYSEQELERESTSAKFAQVRFEGDREIERTILHYNLDVIIAVGYRVKSPLATEFRKWATRKLKEYLLKGYTLNGQLLTQRSDQVVRLQEEIAQLNQKLLGSQKEITTGFLEIITNYARSFELLSKYDNEELTTSGLNEDIIYVINYEEVKRAIKALKEDLMGKGEASELFGNEKDDSFQGVLGSISQTVFGQLAYPSIEEQAAQLIYSVIKGHAFSDGNKRIGSFLFVWFLEQNQFHRGVDGQKKVTDNTLVALALAVAQSLPEQRELMIKLIINLIKT
ncbi:virulence protein RhuM/Fic/DOC family protein [Flammeovirga sp. OC4]|uniref:virulence protein RhuM/Fic/DOC family protein n=1 Tax=Flammeovirga sp. OC4 TaxID=1382345 RepID=UPI000B18C487|nr:virulence protein RhuM/Fic/DOC family protein [Flammeovirga sp. OC4]